MASASSATICRGGSLSLQQRYRQVRDRSLALCSHLAPEDCVVQSMPDVSPTKWHLAHVTWFFERFVLEHFDTAYRRFDKQYHYLFNSYYFTVGEMHARPQRGLLSRPTLAEVNNYRHHVDLHMQALLESRSDDPELQQRITLGLQHEQQHQELMLTDIKHVLSLNPLAPAANPELSKPQALRTEPLGWLQGKSGIVPIGAEPGDGETPRHSILLHEYRLADRLITNGEYREFVQDGAYAEPSLWLADGWTAVNQQGWQRPLYWSADLEQEFTLGGQREIDLQAPVAHISYYEADAFARWACARLPLEGEWETASADHPVAGNFAEDNHWQPAAGRGQWFGDVWEWTASPYVAYPGFQPLAGSLGEYNGKFMCNQLVVRGGSCVSARGHLRHTYRSFFYPDARWQFLGLRLAKDDSAT
jgi:ergothioneine biosynthesis protein EgtB